MYVLHGTWIPEDTDDFIQNGGFYLWVEVPKVRVSRKQPQKHPRHLAGKNLAEYMATELNISPLAQHATTRMIEPKYFLLPSNQNGPLPSPELSRYLETEMPDTFELQYWQIDCCKVETNLMGGGYYQGYVPHVVTLLNDLHYQVLNGQIECQLGADLLFWYHYTQSLPTLILNDHYIPTLKYRALDEPKPEATGARTASPKLSGTKTSKTKTSRAKISGANANIQVTKTSSARSKSTQAPLTQFALYSGWEILSNSYEDSLPYYCDAMPLACCVGVADLPEKPFIYQKETLLRHFTDYWLTALVTHTHLPKTFENQISESLLEDCLRTSYRRYSKTSNSAPEQYRQWQSWRDRIRRTQTDSAFYLCFQLEAPSKPEDPWALTFQVNLKVDPSFRLNLLDYWKMNPGQRWALKVLFGENFETQLLLNLGQAARIYPSLWGGLETAQPAGILLELNAAFEFLQETAWVLESAGYRVIVPSWWTPQGRRRIKMKLRAKATAPTNEKSKSYFSVDNLVEYQYQMAMGDDQVTDQEWQQLVNAKTPLVQFRGEWMMLDQSKMQEMLTFLKKQPKESSTSLLGFMRMAAEQAEFVEVDCDRNNTLTDMLDKLNRRSQIKIVDNPDNLQGDLRDYQKRGLSWLQYMEELGLNGCLADDMGLGKTIQVIARLIQEREVNEDSVPPTLLIVPTSVIGNWYRELETFAPHLFAEIHHGPERAKTLEDFEQLSEENDVIITSFTLARRDLELLQSVPWYRIVLDEAQNIKNPQAAQTKAISQLPAQHRLALTGTPIENRLMDLWSIFNFLNPGYLGSQRLFRENFEGPIQRQNDTVQAQTLRRLVEPFILRRVKTDKSIIQDLPDKIEQKLYCNLTKEQASLYAATVKDVMAQLQAVDGIQRKGIMLATLMKLKQICNHPMQFLQDGSEFTPERSHKLMRLTEMTDEVMEEGESMLIFSQFTEIGAALAQYFHHTCHYNTHYLHGGTPRKKREKMIAEFQSEQSPPSVFVLSLKAGGVGITLTKANHVFHFDRWWNPAVEDQATDRAFRIGQAKKVFVHKFVAVGTLEERIDEMIEDKKKLAGSIVGSDESWLTELDNESFKHLITLNQQAIL